MQRIHVEHITHRICASQTMFRQSTKRAASVFKQQTRAMSGHAHFHHCITHHSNVPLRHTLLHNTRHPLCLLSPLYLFSRLPVGDFTVADEPMIRAQAKQWTMWTLPVVVGIGLVAIYRHGPVLKHTPANHIHTTSPLLLTTTTSYAAAFGH